MQISRIFLQPTSGGCQQTTAVTLASCCCCGGDNFFRGTLFCFDNLRNFAHAGLAQPCFGRLYTQYDFYRTTPYLDQSCPVFFGQFGLVLSGICPVFLARGLVLYCSPVFLVLFWTSFPVFFGPSWTILSGIFSGKWTIVRYFSANLDQTSKSSGIKRPVLIILRVVQLSVREKLYSQIVTWAMFSK